MTMRKLATVLESGRIMIVDCVVYASVVRSTHPVGPVACDMKVVSAGAVNKPLPAQVHGPVVCAVTKSPCKVSPTAGRRDGSTLGMAGPRSKVPRVASGTLKLTSYALAGPSP